MSSRRRAAVSGETVAGPWKVPANWCWRPARELLPLRYGKGLVAGNRRPGPVRVFGSAGPVGHHDEALCEEPALIVGRKGSAGSIYLSDGPSFTIDTAYFCPESQAGIDLKFAYYYLTYSGLARLDRSTAVPSLSRDDFDLVPMPVPDRETQEEIVERIQQLFSEIDEGETALAQARADLEVYRRSLLKAAVTGELTADWRAANPPKETGADLLARILADRRARWHKEPKNAGKRYREPITPPSTNLLPLPSGWTWGTLPQLGEFGRGKSKHRPRNDPKLYGGEYPFVQTGVVTASRGSIVRFSQTYSDLGLAQSKLWPTGTLCITIAANIAHSGVLGFDACFPDSVVGLTCYAGVRADYVHLVMSNIQLILERNAPATAQKNINLDVLEQISIPLPPSDEQQEIISLFQESLAVEAVVKSRDFDEGIGQLRQTILAAAFRGELL